MTSTTGATERTSPVEYVDLAGIPDDDALLGHPVMVRSRALGAWERLHVVLTGLEDANPVVAQAAAALTDPQERLARCALGPGTELTLVRDQDQGTKR